jgi:GntR family transcriptional repressor for pyruvate dehydrogenase complex
VVAMWAQLPAGHALPAQCLRARNGRLQYPMHFRRTAKRRAHGEVVEQVCDAIFAAELRIGDSLPSERDIADQLGISRSSVREAMTVLEESGLVARVSGGGGGTTVVSDVVPVELLGKAMEVSRRRIIDLLEVRSVLEPIAAELAAARADHDQLERLHGILEEAQSLPGNRSGLDQLFLTMDPRFHLAVAKASQNEYLHRLNRSLAKEIAVAVDMIPLDDKYQEIELTTMRRVVQAIAKGNPLEARIAMLIHISHLEPLVHQFFESQGGGGFEVSRPNAPR